MFHFFIKYLKEYASFVQIIYFITLHNNIITHKLLI